jgi:hypothetical protein
MNAPVKKDTVKHDVQDTPAWIGTRAPAPCHDVLRGALYQPKPWNVPRPGAQDFQAAPSVGTPC